MVNQLIADDVLMTGAEDSKDINEKVPVIPITGWNIGTGLKKPEAVCNTTPKDTPTYPLKYYMPLPYGGDLSSKRLS